MTSTAMKYLREAMNRQYGSPVQAGISGENLTRLLLNRQQLAWFSIEQERDTKSTQLSALGAKRTDFVVGLNGNSFLLDSKCMNPERHSSGSVTYTLELDEIEKLKATGNVFGLEVVVIFWDRDASTRSQNYVICSVSQLADEKLIGCKKALSATFSKNEIHTVQLI